MKRDQELIDSIRLELDLSKDEFSDDVLWKNTKNSLLVARISLSISIEQLKKAILNLIRGLK